MSLVSLADLKTYLGIGDATYDTFLTEQEAIISDTIEAYCGRKFLTATYVQTFYREDFDDYDNKFRLPLHAFPVVTLTEILNVEDNTVIAATDYRVHKPTGFITRTDFSWFTDQFNYTNDASLQVTYDAGEAVINNPIKSVIYSLVEERYNKNLRGIDLNFGSDVQRISIPGAISIDFDFSLQANERKSKYGMILGNYTNVLDPYRSERAVIGSIRLEYV